MMLPDYLAPGLDILFCGTAASSTSARVGHYYARNGNRFWRLLAETGLTPRL
ncbi:MAG: mismatch-specific DNA-glycosylase, partial [Pseudorhodobacter sp.]|nr:mismatch-specific DNA-glycosylase [Pseudorhodobacter sp.]